MRTRVLFLDDSGKPDSNHPSRAVVTAGFAVDAERYPTLSRRVLGAKHRFLASRGIPQSWEIKSGDLIKPNPWRRSKNRLLCAEIARLVAVHGGTAYAVTIRKSNMNHPMSLSTTMPLQLQALVEHFAAECDALHASGMVVADWSTHQNDQHASRCVASFAASRRLPVHPCVYYASSHASEGIQVADLIAGIRRRTEEGDTNLVHLDRQLASTSTGTVVGPTVHGRPFRNWITLF
ncbi:MAG TPA: DUF3800 domain-containing protein [Iamia sp.]|nr:DUF3800 domain-containing protein [Iamia sp.]